MALKNSKEVKTPAKLAVNPEASLTVSAFGYVFVVSYGAEIKPGTSSSNPPGSHIVTFAQYHHTAPNGTQSFRKLKNKQKKDPSLKNVLFFFFF